MVLSPGPHQRTLQAQHSLEQDDLLNIYAIAQAENNPHVQNGLDDFGFEQFLGFTCHLFVTTRSQQARERIAKILPKFGSVAVFPLLKIAYHFKSHASPHASQLSQLALSCLRAMTQQALVVGLADAVRASLGDPDIVTIIVMPLIGLIAHYPKTLLSALSQQLDSEDWYMLSAHLIGALSDIKNQRQRSNTERAGTKISGQHNVQVTEPANVAC